MEDILELIKSRRSVRNYSDKPVEKEKLFKILEAGRWSPSSGNVQNWRFVVVNNDSLKLKLAESCLGQYWLTEAPAIIIVCSVEEKIRILFGSRGEQLYSVQNCSVAIQNMLIEATSLGLGSCWVGAYDEEKIKRILRIKDSNVSVRGLITIGYAEEVPPPPKRYELDRLVYFNKWGNKVF